MGEGREEGRPSQSFGYLNHQCYMDIPGRRYRMGIPILEQVIGGFK